MRVHIVQKGDTLWKIAKQYGMGFDELKRLNAHLANPEYIVPGMEIMLPDTATPSKTKMTKEQQTAPMPTPQPQIVEEVELVEEVIPQPTPEPIAEPIQEVIPEVTMPVPEKIKEQPIPEPPAPPQQPMPQQPMPQPAMPQQPMPQPAMPMIFPQPSVQFDFSPQIHAYQQQSQPMLMPMPQPMPMPMPETHLVYVPYIPHQYYHEPAPCGCSQPVTHPPCGCQEMHYPYQSMTMPYYDQPYQEPTYQEPTYQEPIYQEPAYYDSPQYNVAGAYDTPYKTENKLPDWLLDSSSSDSYVLGVRDDKKVDVQHVQQASVDHYDDVCPENEAQVADYYSHTDYYNHAGVMPEQNYPVQYDMRPQHYMPQPMPCGCSYNYPYFNQHSHHPHFTPWNY